MKELKQMLIAVISVLGIIILMIGFICKTVYSIGYEQGIRHSEECSEIPLIGIAVEDTLGLTGKHLRH